MKRLLLLASPAFAVRLFAASLSFHEETGVSRTNIFYIHVVKPLNQKLPPDYMYVLVLHVLPPTTVLHVSCFQTTCMYSPYRVLPPTVVLSGACK